MVEGLEEGIVVATLRITRTFTKNGFSKRTILHEFYHHLVDTRGWELPSRIEEKDARNYEREFRRSRYS